MSQVLRQAKLPPMPVNSLGPGGIRDPTVRARSGASSEDHPVHVRVLWDTGDTEEVWGIVTEWNGEALRVHIGRHGEGWY